jgi:hypothetical protein
VGSTCGIVRGSRKGMLQIYYRWLKRVRLVYYIFILFFLTLAHMKMFQITVNTLFE